MCSVTNFYKNMFIKVSNYFIFLLTEGDLCSLSERGKGAYNMS